MWKFLIIGIGILSLIPLVIQTTEVVQDADPLADINIYDLA